MLHGVNLGFVHGIDWGSGAGFAVISNVYLAYSLSSPLKVWIPLFKEEELRIHGQERKYPKLRTCDPCVPSLIRAMAVIPRLEGSP